MRAFKFTCSKLIFLHTILIHRTHGVILQTLYFSIKLIGGCMNETNNDNNENEYEEISHIKVSGKGIFTGENTPDPPKLSVDFEKNENLEIKHAVAITDFILLVNKQFAENNTAHDTAETVQETLNDFVNEVDDMPLHKMNTFKREKVSNKVMALADAVLNVLPHSMDTINTFIPLAKFGELIGKDIQQIMKIKYNIT
jgi:hypothetical protein